MNDQRKTKAQLLDELIELRQRVAQFDAINHQGMTSDQTSSAMRQAETDLKKVQAAAHVGHWTWDVQSNRVSWSDEMFRIFGLNPIGFSGDLDEVIRTAIHPDDRAKVDQANTAVSESGQPAPLEYRVVWSDGTVRTVYAEPAEQTRDEHGNVIRLWGIVQDITERQRMEEKVERQNRRLQILREIDVAILAADSVEDIVAAALNHIRELVGCRQASVTLFEWHTNELMVFEASSDDARVPRGTRMPLTVLGDRLQALRQNQTLLVHDFAELRVPSPSDLVLMSAGLRSACGLPLFVQNELIGALALVSDIPGFFDEEKIALGREVANQVAIAITQHRLVEALHASEEQHRALFQNSLDAILLTSPDGSILAANPAACKMLGRTEAEICRLGRSGLVDMTDPRVAGLLAERARTGQALGELTMLRNDGSPFPVEMSSVLFKDQQGHLRSSMIVRDITARKQAEQDLRESEQLFSTIFRDSPIALSLVEVPGGKNLEVNAAWCTLTGYSREEAIGYDTGELKIFNPEERARLIAAFSTQGRSRLVESEITTRRGAQRNVLITSELIMIRERQLIIASVLDITERRQAEAQIRAQAIRLKILADASQAFAAVGQDYQAVLDQVVRQVTDVLADMCQMRLLSDDGQVLKLAALYSRDPEFSQALRQIAPSLSERTDDRGLAPYVFHTGKPAFVPVITVDQLLASLPPEYEGIDRRFAPHSYIVVPLRIQGRSLGVMALTRYQVGRSAFTEDDVTLAQDLADRAALAINSARLFQQVQNELTERKRAEVRILRLNRLYATLSQINQTIVRARDRDTLFREICRVAIEFGQFRLAWIGLIDEAEQRVRPVAFAGEEQGYLTNVSVKYRDETLGRGPTGTAIREGRCVICQDIATNPLMTPWRDQALQRGYGSSAAVPIRQNTDVVGALTVYASEPDGFDADDERLLDEIGLDISFALDMLEQEAQRLRAEDALQSLNLELEQRVVRRTAELAAANERLTELDRLKSKFVSTVTHELRTPVTSLGLLVDLLEHGKPEKREQYLARLRGQMTRLQTMINDILDLSRLERDAIEADWATVDIGPMIEHVVAMQRVAAETAGLQLSSEVSAGPVWVRARPEHLLQAITNLISNAIKYTRTGAVDVITFTEVERLCVQIKDTGLGIAPEDVSHLFERFYRGKQAAQSSIPGTGLGLSIVKEIAEAHGGTVEVESTLGVGSTFRLWLPLIVG